MVNVLRINELAKKSRETGLTEAEKSEQAELRREYIESMRRSLQAELDNTYVIGTDGKKTKLRKKEGSDREK